MCVRSHSCLYACPHTFGVVPPQLIANRILELLVVDGLNAILFSESVGLENLVFDVKVSMYDFSLIHRIKTFRNLQYDILHF